MKTEQTFSNTLCMRSLKAPTEFCSGGIRGCSQVEMLAGHLKHSICGNLSTWKPCTWLRQYSSTCRLKYAIKPRFYSGHRGGLLWQQGIKGLALTFSPSPTMHNFNLLFAMLIKIYTLFCIMHLIGRSLSAAISLVCKVTGGLQGSCHLWIRCFQKKLANMW